jgi:hypothetical protein
VYRSSKSRKRRNESDKNYHEPPSGGANGQSEDEDAGDAMSEDEEDDNGPLLTVQPGFNKLLLVLRDERVIHFVKYLSASAPGCRWDVYGEWEVGMIEESESGTSS